MATLSELMKNGGKSSPSKRTVEPQMGEHAEEAYLNGLDDREEEVGTKNAPSQPSTARPLSGLFTGIEIEAVVGGALMRISLAAGVSPIEVPALLRQLDPQAKWREDFPSKGNFGKRETKTARALVVNADVRDNGKFISLTVTTGADDFTVQVSKKAADEFLPKVEALKKLSEKNLEKLRNAFTAKKPATIVLSESDQFGVRYWTTDDGKAFLDDLEAEPPAPVAAEGGASE